MQLPLLTDPAADKRSGELAKAQLLFFPTGGGKTEAYLGLAAYAFAIRRLQDVVQTPDGPLDGRAGVTVLMRYTLRLLTAQQFQRATALVCAAELARLRDEATWGTEPFRIGLWVGTDVSPKRYDEAESQLKRAANAGSGYRLTVLQIQRCPWCGTPIGRRQRAGRSRGPADLRVLRRRAGRLPVRAGRGGGGRAAGPHRGRGDLPARARVRDRDRRQVRAARAGGRGRVAVRLRVAAVRPARLRAPRLPVVRRSRTAASTRSPPPPCTRSPGSGRPT